jgi:hypothetical protein
MEVKVPIIHFQGLIIALTWSNGFCGERGKKGGMVGKGKGPWQKKISYNKFLIIINLGLSIQLLPLCALIIS